MPFNWQELEGRPSDESSSSSEDEEVWREARRKRKMAAAADDRPGEGSGERGRVEMVAVSGRAGTAREGQKGASLK